KVGGKVFALDYGRLMGDPSYSAVITPVISSLKLGQAADELRAKHIRLGEVMARACRTPPATWASCAASTIGWARPSLEAIIGDAH
ncbi:MAG TPA: hypothetical protein PK170_09145, partial [Anaerolineae bacterium]|nr:hypothetical protein [Anaerolineae bacterium]HRK77075.1 hypothetical protein [Thiobacillus sp.]